MALNQRLERIDGLHPMLHAPAKRLIGLCDEKLHRTLMVVYGWRSVQEQQLIYQHGRTMTVATGLWEITDPKLVVTRALPGTSAHNVITVKGDRAAMALDLIPINADGTANWTPGEDFWDALYELSWKCGLDPLGDPIGGYLPNDKGHLEEPGWRLKLDGLGCLLPAVGTATPV